MATLRGATRLLLGISPDTSGVSSAGNGPAMRSALLGVCSDDDEHMRALVRASTRMTHTDPRAEDGALLIARLARQLCRGTVDEHALLNGIRDDPFRVRVRDAFSFAQSKHGIEEFRAKAGNFKGVSGFVVDTIPAAIFSWARHSAEPRGAIETAIRLGGDTDTVAAITGALVGTQVGASGLPKRWIDGICDWPLSVRYIRALANGLATGGELPRPRSWARAPRNVLVLMLVLGHLAKRTVGR